jgi:hypothetical protein
MNSVTGPHAPDMHAMVHYISFEVADMLRMHGNGRDVPHDHFFGQSAMICDPHEEGLFDHHVVCFLVDSGCNC